MRLWTVHPGYLDVRGLVALWREALLAQKVLLGGTKGYTRHPQLTRFRAAPEPIAAIASYLDGVWEEATARGYNFDRRKIVSTRFAGTIPETTGQLRYEWTHLQRKLKSRSPERYAVGLGIELPAPHPLFAIVDGGVQEWERRDAGEAGQEQR